jgi:hypothetical protein
MSITAAIVGGAASVIGSAINSGFGYASSQESLDKQLKQQEELERERMLADMNQKQGSGFQMLPFEIPDYGVDVPQQTASISSVIGSTGIGLPPMTGGEFNQPPPPALF